MNEKELQKVYSGIREWAELAIKYNWTRRRGRKYWPKLKYWWDEKFNDGYENRLARDSLFEHIETYIRLHLHEK